MDKVKNSDSCRYTGYRILYDAKGCSFSDYDEYLTNFDVAGKYDVQAYFGPKPKHGIQIVSGCSKYIVPGNDAVFGKIEFMAETDGKTDYSPFFFEVVVRVQADELSSMANTIDELLRNAESRREEFKNVIYLVAGIIGLRFQRQFVLEPLNENTLAWLDNAPSQNACTPFLECLELISINGHGIQFLEALKQPFACLSLEVVEKNSLIFHWLLRAWRERDPLHKFIALFVPLEALLTTFTDLKMSADNREKAKSIRMAIEKYADSNADELLLFFNKLINKAGPTLEDRFVDIATEAKLPGWKSDIEAFKKYQIMRNMLLHGRDTNVEHNITIREEEVRTLQDTVERYVNFCLFRDNNVYRSRWRQSIDEVKD